MEKKFSVLLIAILLLAAAGHGQDSIRTKNDKPGTPQSLRVPDQAPQSHVDITNGQSNRVVINEPSESNTVDNTTGQTIITNSNTSDKPVSTTPITLSKRPPGRTRDSTNSSAIQNGISNTTNPTRKQ